MHTRILLGVCFAFLVHSTVAADEPKKIDSLIRDLNDAGKRLPALLELAELGPKAAPAVPALVKMLHVKDNDVRLNAAIALGKVGKTAVELLVAELASKDDEVRLHAVWAIAWIGSPAKGATPAVIKALSDPNQDVRRKAAYTIGRIDADPKVIAPPLVKALGDASHDVHEIAADTLTKLKGSAVPALIDGLEKGADPIRYQATVVLGKIGPAASGAVPALRTYLLAKDTQNPWHVAWTLSRIGKESLGALIDGIKDERLLVHRSCVDVIGGLGRPALPTLFDALKDKRVAIRQSAAVSLGYMGISDKELVEALAAATGDEDPIVRTRAIHSLSKIGTNLQPAATQARKMLTDPNPAIDPFPLPRESAFAVLKSIGGDQLRAGLVEALATKDKAIRVDIAARMSKHNVEWKLAAPVLEAALFDKDLTLAVRVQAALATKGELMTKAAPVLGEGAAMGLDGQGWHCLDMLNRMGWNGKAAGASLVKLFDAPTAEQRMRVMATLANISGDSKVLVPALAKVIKNDKNQHVRREAVRALWLHGTLAIPVLLEAYKDKDEGIRYQALWSLANVMELTDGKVEYMPGAAPLLAPLTKEKDFKLRRAGIEALVRCGKQSLAVLAEVAESEENAQLRQIAVDAVKRFKAMK